MIKNVSDMSKTANLYEVIKRFVFVFTLFAAIDTAAIYAGDIIPSHPVDNKLAEIFIIMVSVIIALVVVFSTLKKLNLRYKQSSYLEYLANIDRDVLDDAIKSPALSEQSRTLVLNYLRHNHLQSIKND